jgi:hypothetical protein
MYHHFGSLRKAASALSKSTALGASASVSVASIWRWCQNLKPKVRSLQSYTSKVTSAMLTLTQAIILQAPCTTQRELGAALSKAFDANISQHLVRTIMKACNFTRKRTRVRGYSLRKEERVRSFLEHDVPILLKCPLKVSLDETGFDPRTKRTYGYSVSGQPAIVTPTKVAQCPSYSWTVLMAVASTGEHFQVLCKERVRAATFEAFIRSLPFPPGTHILLDNASIHATKDVRKAAADKGYKLCFTPPYSPEMNPIELVFGTVKQRFYRKRIRWEGDYESCVNDALSAVNPSLIRNCFRHVQDVFWVGS